MDQTQHKLINNRVTPHSDRNSLDDETDYGIGCCSYFVVGLVIFLIILTFPFSLFACIQIIPEYERAVIFRLGRIIRRGTSGPGLVLVLPCADTVVRMDLRTVNFNVPPQEILTKDSVTVSVDAVVFYRITDPVIAANNVANADYCTRSLAQTTLRNSLGTRLLSEILADRESLSRSMEEILHEATPKWGILVERVEIKDARLPVQLQRAMAAEAEADRNANAKVIAAEGEQKASRALREAADIMSESPAALQLRYLQTLNSISAEKNSTVIFPLPMEIMSYFAKN